jgi:hypothetical protein
MPKFRPVFIALFLCVSAFSQPGKKLPLKTILADIAALHHVTFNYIEDEIVIYKIIPPETSLSLEAKLDHIVTRTYVRFKGIGNDSYTVVNDKKLDKPLCGFLIDAGTGMPVEAASLSIVNTQFFTVSDKNGYFQLPVVSPEMIVIKHQNYQETSIDPTDIYKPACPEVRLIPVINNLEEIVAQRYLTTGISKNADGSFRIVPQHFGILPGLIEPDVLQTMQQLPGINNEDETISNISVRGGTHDQNLFLWNGIRMFQTGHFFGLISAFNSALPQTIFISRNGTPAFFGESVSSVVDISSHTKATAPTQTVISADMISAEFYSKFRLSEKASIGISARRSFTDMVASPTYVDYRNRIFQNTVVTNLGDNTNVPYRSDEHFYFYDFSIGYEQKIGERHELSVDAISIANSLIIDQFSQSAHKNNNLGQRNYGGTIDWKAKWNPMHSSKINAYLSYYNLNASTETFSTGQLLEQKNSVLDLGFKFSHSYRISETFTVNAGYQFNETGVTNFDEVNTPFFSRNTTEVLRSHALVTEAVIRRKDDRTLLKAGFRLNYYEVFGVFIPEVRMQFSQKLSEAFRLEILGEQKSQTMSQIIDLQQDFLGIEKRRWTLADNDTKPIQKSDQVSVGLTFKKSNWLVTLDNFYKQVNGITTAGQGFQNQYEFVYAQGSYRVLGSELLVQKNFGHFYSWLSYGINDNRYEFDSFSPHHFPNNFELTHAASLAAIYEWKKLKIALGTKWHSGRPVTTPASSEVDISDPGQPQISYNEPNNSRLPDFFVVNFSASKSWKLGKALSLQASVSVLNLLDKRNVVNRFYRVNSDLQIESVNTFALGRTPNVNLKVTF